MNGSEKDYPSGTSPALSEEETCMVKVMAAETARSRVKENRRVLILVSLVGVFMILAHFTPLKAWITNVQEWKAFVNELGWVAHLSYLLACAGGVMVGLPRLPLCAGAGLIFGFVEGLTLSLLGSTFGSYGAFIMARAGARHAVLTKLERWPWLTKMIERPTWLKVFWVRQMMLPGLVLNVLLGVTEVTHNTFLFGTMVGYLPLNIAFSLVGSGLGKGNLAHSLTQLLGALAVVNIVGWLVWTKTRLKRA